MNLDQDFFDKNDIVGFCFRLGLVKGSLEEPCGIILGRDRV